MTAIRVAQRGFPAGELDPRANGLVDNAQYARGLRRGVGLIFSEFGTAQKRYGTVNVANALEVIPAIFGLDIPGVGARTIIVSGNNIEIYDAVARTVEDTVSWGSEWTLFASMLSAITITFQNSVWFLHPDEQPLILERDALGNWTLDTIRDKDEFVEPLLEPRPLSTTITKSSTKLTAGTDLFIPEDAAGNGSLWFLGTDDAGVTNPSGWVHATKFETPTVLTHAGNGDWEASDGVVSTDWAGPFKVNGSYSNTLNLSGVLTIGGAFNTTLTGGELTLATDVGMVIAFDGNVRLLGLVLSVTSSTVLKCRVIDANGGSLAASYSGTSNLFRPNFREYDGNYLMLDHESVSPSRLFSRDPIMNAGMVTTVNDRDARFDIGNSRQVTRVATLSDINNVTVTFATKTWDPRDLAPRMNYSPLMSDYHGWPGTGVIHQARAVLSGFKLAPSTVLSSKTSQPLNFQRGSDDNAGMSLLLDISRGTISWLASAQDLLVGTTLSEYAMRGAPITPSNIKAELQTTYGGLRDVVTIVGGAAIFVTRCGCGLREMAFRFESDRFSAPDLTDLNQLWSTILPAATTFRQPSYVREPNPIIIAIGDDFQPTALTYRRDNGVVAWSPWTFPLSAGEPEGNRDRVNSIATVPTTTQRDETWITTRRYVNGALKDLVEIISDEAIFDCEKTVTSPGSTTITGLSDYEDRVVAVVADDVWLGYYTVVADQIDLSNHLGSPPTEVVLGYEILCEIDPQVLQLDDGRSGASDGRQRSIKNVLLNLVASYGGEVGFISAQNAGADVETFNALFPEIVEGTTLASARFTGIKNVSVNMAGEEPTARIRAKGPWPFLLSSVNVSVEVGD